MVQWPYAPQRRNLRFKVFGDCGSAKDYVKSVIRYDRVAISTAKWVEGDDGRKQSLSSVLSRGVEHTFLKGGGHTWWRNTAKGDSCRFSWCKIYELAVRFVVCWDSLLLLKNNYEERRPKAMTWEQLVTKYHE